jgi:hypothetical protein
MRVHVCRTKAHLDVHSVGVQRQYTGRAGWIENAGRRVPGLRLLAEPGIDGPRYVRPEFVG